MALAECCISGDKLMGATIEIDGSGNRKDALLFGESQSRIILSLPKIHMEKLEDIACRNETPLEVIGEVGGDHLLIDDYISLSLDDMHSAWSRAIEEKIS